MCTGIVARGIVMRLVLVQSARGAVMPQEGQSVVMPTVPAPWMGSRLMEASEEAARTTGDDLRAAFLADPSASGAWRRLAGWNDTMVQPCENTAPNGVYWTGVTCARDQVMKVDLSHAPDLKFTLGNQLNKLIVLTNLKLRDTGLHGWIPPMGNLQDLLELDVSGTSISGTIPREIFRLPHLETLNCDNTGMEGEIGPFSTAITQVLAAYTQVSGTLPEMIESAKLQTLSIIKTAISGTVPASLTQQQDISRLYMYYTQLSGTFPSVEMAYNLIEIDVDSTCPHSPNAGLSGTLPAGIENLLATTNLDFHNNMISGTIPYLISDATSRRSLQTLYLQETFISGTVPPLGCLANLTKLDLHDSEFTGFAPAISTPNSTCGSLPGSLTHLYAQGNPINMTSNTVNVLLNQLDLHVLDFSFINIPVQLDCRDSKCSKGDRPMVLLSKSKSFGTRAGRPTNGICYVGGACAFRLLLYDIDDQPVKVGGLMHNMSIRLGTEQIHPMIEGHNGAFDAAIPTDWITKPGTYTFRFFHNELEFTPVMLEGDIFAPWPGCYSMETQELKPPGTCDTLRAITFLPACEDGSKLSTDGSRCECDSKYYDTDLAGILVCSTGSWSDPELLKEYNEVQYDHNRGIKCARCPTQCVTCEKGNAIIKPGWRLKGMNATEVRQQTSNIAYGQAQFVFACPWPAACPALNISSPSEEQCLTNHQGVLCGPCRPGFSRKGSSDNSCLRCNDISAYIRLQFGLDLAAFCLIILAIACVVCGVLYAAAQFLSPWLKIAKTNGRILLGSAQVLSLLPSVLQIVFPQQPRSMLLFLSVGVVDVRDFVRFDCWGLDWYERWLLSVFGLPCAAALPFVSRWVWQSMRLRLKDEDIDPNAKREIDENAVNGLFFIVLLLYPQLSSEIFSALRCRQLGKHSRWLEVDYLIDCTGDHYRTYQTLASILVVIVPIGIPLVLLGLLLKSWRRSIARWNQGPGKDARLTLIGTRSWDPRDSIFAERQPGGDQEVDSVFEYHRMQLQGTFAFCVDDYRNECFWFEPFDMLRKLSLSALLQFCNRGTAAQVFCGSAVAFMSFGVQLRLQPYREPESNTLKAIVEAQIFLTFIIAFILRVLPDISTSEPFDTDFYGMVLLVSVLLLLLVAMPSLTGVQIYRQYRFRTGLTDMPDGRLLNVDSAHVLDSVAQ